MDETLSKLSKEEKWFQTLLSLPGALPDNPSRSLESIHALNRRLDSLGLEEVQLNLDNESDSLFASFIFWEQRYASGLGPQLLAEKNPETPFAAPVDRLAAVRQQVNCPAHASFQTFYMLVKHFPYRIFLVFPEGTYCVPDPDFHATKSIMIFSCCEKFFFRPAIFRHPNPSIGTYDLAANMFPFLGRIMEASLTTDLPQLDIELSLGRDLVKEKIPAFKDKKKFVYDEDESRIVFFGPQQVGKSRTINNILRTSMASVTTDIYKLITCWYWHSFQTEWLEEEIIPLGDEDDFDVNEGLDRAGDFVVEWGGVDLSAQPLPQGYVVPEGGAFSTTSVSTEIKFGCQFAISFIFHSEEFVAAELASYKRYLAMKQQDELHSEEFSNTDHFPRGEVMIGPVKEPAHINDVKLNNTFANKLGRCVRYCSPHVDVAKSIEFIKSKYAFYGSSEQKVWGLLRSIIIEMPVPLLIGGGRLIDSPGLVEHDNVRREQTMAALHNASAVVYVASTQEFGDVADKFQKTSFFMNYARSIAEECLEAMKTQTELKRTVLPKLMFVFNSDKNEFPGSVTQLKSFVNIHLQRLRSKFFQSFRNSILHVVSSVYRSQPQIPPFDERKFLHFVEDSLMSIINPLEDPLAPDVVNKSNAKKVKTSGVLERIFVTAFNSLPNAPVAHGRVTFMHTLFTYARDKHISPEAAGIPLFLNTLKRLLGGSYKSVGDKSGELMKQIHKELKNRLKMESIKDESFMVKINARLEEIRKRVKRQFTDFENSALELWIPPKRKRVDEEVSQLIELSDKCTVESLLENLKQEMDTADKKKLDDMLNRLCRQRGEASGISLTALALKPLWQGFDLTLQNLTELMLPSSPPKLPENEFDGHSISNQLQKVIDKSFALKEEDDEIVAKFIGLEKKRFTNHIRNALKVFNFNQNFALEKESLKIFCQQQMELFLEENEKNLRAVKGIVALREAYLKEGIKGYAEKCCNEMRNRLGQRVKLIIENFIGHTRNSKLKLKQIVKRAGDGITQRYKKTADEKEIGALYKLQNYFKACMLSLYRSMIDNVVEHRQDIYDYVLKAMVEFDLGSGKDLPATLDAIEWRNFLQAFMHTIDNRWSFLEKKAVVDFSIEVSSKDNGTESNYIAVPTTYYKEINQLLKQKYPIANSGLERKQYAVKNLTVQLRNKFLTTKEAKEYFECYLNVHEDVQRAFFPAAINLRNLQLRRLILLKFLEANTFFDIEQLDELERLEMVANINNGLVEIARLNNNTESLEILQSDRQLIEAISLLQLEFETPQKAAEIVDQMLERIQKRLKKRAVKDIPMNKNDNNDVDPAIEKRAMSASKKRKAAPAAKKKRVESEEYSHEPNPPKKKKQNRSGIDRPAHGTKQSNNNNKPANKRKAAAYEDDEFITEKPKSAKKKYKKVIESDEDDADDPYVPIAPKSVKKSQAVESDDDDEPFVLSPEEGKSVESGDDGELYFASSDDHDLTPIKKGPKRRSQAKTNQTKGTKITVRATQRTKAGTGAKAKAVQKKKKVSAESDYEEESDFIVNDEDYVLDEMNYEESLVEEDIPNEKPKAGTKRKRPVIESSDESHEERLTKKKR